MIFQALTIAVTYCLLFTFDQLRDLFRKIIEWGRASNLQGYAPICLGLEDFYTRRSYLRIQDCFGRPISSPPDAWFDVVERVSNDNNKTLKLLYTKPTALQEVVLPSEFKCSLCNSYFKNAMMIPCCQHSFCDKCSWV